MCRAEVEPDAEALLGALLGQIAENLAREDGCDPAEVVVGPVDFGGEW